MRAWITILCLASMTLFSCTEEIDVLIPQSPGYGLPPGTRALPAAARHAMEGIYTVAEGPPILGDVVALRWSYVAQGTDTTHYLSIFCGREVLYFVLDGGRRDSSCHFAGYWRKLVSTETGNAILSIAPASGASSLLAATPRVVPDSLVLAGRFQWEESSDRPITLRYRRPLYRPKPFAVIAHRAGGRNSDLLPASENTIEMVLMAERFGATGVEIDVQLTRDGVPIVYHDERLNLRLNEKNGLVGPAEDYTYAQLQTFVRLIHGERIPTLQEMLVAILERTNIRLVWLDMKSAKPSMAQVRAVQRFVMSRMSALTQNSNRDPLSILIGLPTEEKVNEFLTLPDYANAPALCELSMDDARKTGAVVWAPRWTLGTQDAEVAQMHAEGRKVVVWTLDMPAYVAQYIARGNLDGILTNYPSIVAFYSYVALPQ